MTDDEHAEHSGPSCHHAGPTEERVARFIENGLSPEAAAAAMRIDETLASIRRSMVRREMSRRAIADLNLDIDTVHMDVLWAVGCDGAEVTVGLVAERMGIDPSRASRLVAEVVDRGLLRRAASQADARRICLELTEAGAAYQSAMQEYKAWIFAEALRSWPEDELAAFAKKFEELSNWVARTRQTSHAEHFAPLAERLRKLRQPPQ